MHRLRVLAVRLVNLFRRTTLDRDLREQIESHLQMLEDDFIRRGMEPSAARVSARRALGNQLLVRELARDQQSFAPLDTLASDVRLAARRLRRQPGTAVASVLALSAGIAAATTCWTLLSTVLLHPLPVHDSDSLVIVGSRFNQHGYPLYTRVGNSGVFEATAGGGSLEVLVGREHPEPAVAYFASHDFLDVLGVSPALGRDFTAVDDRRGAPQVAMLSHRYWQHAFGGRRDVLGAEVVVAGQPATVVGILPRQFRGLDLTELPDVYLPLHTVELSDAAGGGQGFLTVDARTAVSWITVIGRLRPDTEQAQVANRLSALFPDASWSRTPDAVTSLNAAAVPTTAGWLTFASGLLIAVTVALVLATGCLAAGSLLVLRTEARRDELAMCLALGASKARLVRGVVAEGGLLALAGLLTALPASAWLLAGIRVFELPGGVQIDVAALSVDTSALLVAGGAALLATLAVTLLAASSVFSVGAAGGQRARAGATPRLGRIRTRMILGAAQMAVALVLLAGAALFARSIAGTLAVGPEEPVRALVTGRISLGAYGHTPEQAAAFFDALEQRLGARSAIQGLSMATAFSNSQGGVTIVDGARRHLPSYIYYQGVDDQYFPLLGLPITSGRGFSADDREESPTVAVISASLAGLLFGTADPLGHELGPIFWRTTPATVVGVVPDVVTNLALRSPYVIYMPIAQTPVTRRTLFLRASGDPSVGIREVSSAIRAIDPSIVPPPMETVGQRVDAHARAQRFGVLVMGAVGIAAALLTALAVFVMATSLAARRRRELGIRSALGAPRAHLAFIVLRESVLVAGIGILAGAAVVWWGSALEPMRAFLFQVEPFDPLSVAGAAALLMVLVLIVSLKPARAAMRQDVTRVLVEE